MMSHYMTWLIVYGCYSKTAYRNADVLSQLIYRITYHRGTPGYLYRSYDIVNKLVCTNYSVIIIIIL